MKQSIYDNLVLLKNRYTDIVKVLAEDTLNYDFTYIINLQKELATLKPVVDKFAQYCAVTADNNTATAMLADQELKDFAIVEIQIAKDTLVQLDWELQQLLLPKDINDDKNIYLEIRAGTGGEESALFAAALCRMYMRYAERVGWQTEIISVSDSELGGYKELILRIVGTGVFARLKFESGAHRVQRVPLTEAQGRIHTSACTVAVMAEADELAAVELNSADLRIDTYRASGAGGQHINKTDSAIRITHLPTGTVVECQDDRSQHKNKARAMSLLASKIKDQQLRQQQTQEAAQRKTLVGSGDRSERIRTYNFPQGRMTDHRINLTLYKLDAIMDGDLTEVIAALIAKYHTELLAAAC